MAVGGLSEQFNKNKSYITDGDTSEPYLFRNFVDSFQELVDNLLKDIVNPTEAQLSNKKENKRRKLFLDKGETLGYFKDYLQQFLTVFRQFFKYVDKIRHSSKATKEEILKHMADWDSNFEGLREEMRDAKNSLKNAKEKSTTKLMAKRFSCLLEQTNRIIYYFNHGLLKKMYVK